MNMAGTQGIAAAMCGAVLALAYEVAALSPAIDAPNTEGQEFVLDGEGLMLAQAGGSADDTGLQEHMRSHALRYASMVERAYGRLHGHIRNRSTAATSWSGAAIPPPATGWEAVWTAAGVRARYCDGVLLVYIAPAALKGTGVVACPVAASAQAVPTLEATAFTVVHDTESELVYGFAEFLPGQHDHRLGLYVHCERSSGRLRAGMGFGAFPAEKPVQAAVRAGDGTVERFGRVLVGGPLTGFHDPLIEDRVDVLRLLAVAFTEGALLSNGHNSVWNRISESENRRVREALVRCAGE